MPRPVRHHRKVSKHSAKARRSRKASLQSKHVEHVIEEKQVAPSGCVAEIFEVEMISPEELPEVEEFEFIKGD